MFLELEEGIDGFVRIGDLSWTKRLKHPRDFVRSQKTLDAVVVNIDIENRRLSLSHKDIEDNPWIALEDTFVRGSVHTCRVLHKTDKVAILELPYTLEGISFLKNIVKQDGSSAEVGETLDFMILDFDKNDRRILLSHTHTYKAKADKSRQKRSEQTTHFVRNINKDDSKSTLGDIEALSSLKKSMSGDKVAKKGSKANKSASKSGDIESNTDAQDNG